MSNCPACDFDLDAKWSTYWETRINHTAKSGNSIGSSGPGSKGWKYRNERKKVSLLKWTWLGRGPTQATVKRRLWITRLWGKGQRAFDKDNLYWGLKPLVDEIKARGWIREDSPKWVERICRQEKSPDGINHISIRIEELDV